MAHNHIIFNYTVVTLSGISRLRAINLDSLTEREILAHSPAQLSGSS